jgi:hypothetical protein
MRAFLLCLVGAILASGVVSGLFVGSALAAEPEAKAEQKLSNRTALEKWQVVDRSDFARHGKVQLESDRIVLAAGKPATGIRWTGEVPRLDYEITLEAMRVEGSDFFCGLTFPVGEGQCTLILGGWGGSVVGLSNINGASAAENESSCAVDFKNGQWYKIRLWVTGSEIHVWIDEKEVIHVPTRGRQFSIWWEQEPVSPLGVATWHTTGALRAISLRKRP